MQTGDIFADRYQIKGILGKGGMGAVYLAEDSLLKNTEVALKVLLPEFYSDGSSYGERFIQEGELTRKVNHPNVVRTYDFGKSGQDLYMTMEVVRGKTLGASLKQGKKYTKEEAASIMTSICKGLQAIHAEGIVHRDITAGNVIISESGEVKIMDFGVARHMQRDSNLTAPDEIIGSAPYIAPEIWKAHGAACQASDFYSLGIVLYEMLTGKRPFKADNAAQYMFQHLDGKRVPPSEVNPEASAFDSLSVKLLEQEIEDRPKSIEEIIAVLERIATPPQGLISSVMGLFKKG